MNSPYLILRLRGGMGNQLFEYAAARSLALRNRVPLILDTMTGFREDRYGRRYELGAFQVVCDGIDTENSASLGWRRELDRKLTSRREQMRMRLFGRYFDPAIYNMRIERSRILDAHCQSPRYFAGIEQLLRKELAFVSAPQDLNPSLVKDVRESNSVCLHARRLHGKEADGNTPQLVAGYYGACDIAYYRNAIQEIVALHGPLRIFIFSDDLDWARENAGAFHVAGCSAAVIDDCDPLRNYYLMQLCRHFIIANSTFSWWAAWLGSYPRKTVCVPAVWNCGERYYPRDLFPSDWRVVGASRGAEEGAGALQLAGIYE